MTIESEIFDALEVALTAGLPWLKHLERDRPFTDLAVINTEMPLVQFFWDPVESVQEMQRSFTDTSAALVIEIVAANTQILEMTQDKLFQYRTDVLDVLSENVGLPDVAGFVQFAYNGRVYDLHSSDNFYIARLRFTALYREAYGADC